MTHYAIIRSSGRVVRVERWGRILLVYGEGPPNHPWDANGYLPVHTCRYDQRFQLMPRGWSP